MNEKPLPEFPVRPVVEIPRFVPDGSASGVCDPYFVQDPTRLFIRPYRELGPIFRVRLFGRDNIAMGGVEANAFTWNNHRLWNYYKTNHHFREQFSRRYLNQLEGAEYTQKRKRISHGFRPRMLMSHTDKMSEVIFREIERLPNGETELRIFCMRVIIAMISQVLIQRELPEGMDTTMAISNKEMLKSSSLGWKRWLWYAYPPKLWKRRKIFQYLGSILDEYQQNPDLGDDDILASVLTAKDPNDPPIPRYELIHDLSQLFMAGSTTSSMIIAWSLIHTYTDASWLGELREELKDWDPFAFDSIKPYPKLRATTLEVERLHPGVPVFHRVAAEEFEFGGYRVPKDADVLHLHTLAHFLDEVYENPGHFNPRRFVENPDLPSKDVHGTFGGGQHKCLGSPLARIQPPLFTANVVSRYDVEFLTRPSLKEKYDAVTAPAEEPLMIKFHER